MASDVILKVALMNKYSDICIQLKQSDIVINKL